MIEICHVSDLHFGKTNSQNRKAKMLLDTIHKEFGEKDNSYLLVTGDLTDQGNEDQYDLAKQALLPFAGQVFITPGNHDYAGNDSGTDYSKERAKAFDELAEALQFDHAFFDKTVYRCDLKDQNGNTLILIGLNSCAKVGTEDWAQGEIGKPQRDQLQQILAECDKNAPDTPRILFLHHIPNRAAFPSFMMSLKDREELMEVVKKTRVDVLAFGHQGWGMKVDSRGKSRTTRAPIRPMKVRKLRYGRDDAVKRTTWLLDADDSVAEQACYCITWNGKDLTPGIWPDRRRIQRTVAPSKNIKSKKKPIKKK